MFLGGEPSQQIYGLIATCRQELILKFRFPTPQLRSKRLLSISSTRTSSLFLKKDSIFTWKVQIQHHCDFE